MGSAERRKQQAIEVADQAVTNALQAWQSFADFLAIVEAGQEKVTPQQIAEFRALAQRNIAAMNQQRKVMDGIR